MAERLNSNGPSWLPEPHQVLRSNGDSVVELRQNGAVVGELNFTKIMSNVLGMMGFEVQREPHLKAVE